MREVTRTVYEAFDGAPFDTSAACRAYERDNAYKRLIGLTAEQVTDALMGTGEVADAIMTVAYKIRPLRPKAVRRDDVDEGPELPAPVGRERTLTAAEAEAVTK